MAPEPLHRRAFLAAGGGLLALAACKPDKPWHSVEVKGALPALSFDMTRAEDGKAVTERDYRGKLVMLFFGYTHCPDVCPLTMANVAAVLGQMGGSASEVRALFVTVDPDRDTDAVLADYAANFGPEVVGLRGTQNQLARLARRYRVTYSVTPAKGDQPYQVVHGPSIYVFDRTGRARLLIPKFYDSQADLAGVTEDMLRLERAG